MLIIYIYHNDAKCRYPAFVHHKSPCQERNLSLCQVMVKTLPCSQHHASDIGNILFSGLEDGQISSRLHEA